MDPATMYAISQGIGFISDSMQADKEQKANSELQKIIQETAGKFLDTSEDMFSVARYFQPGGGAFRDAKETAIDTAFMTAQKGSEDLMSKGVNLTSYGMGTAADIIKDTFTKNIMSDYKELSSIGQGYANIALEAQTKWGDYMTTGAQADYINTVGGTNPMSNLVSGFSDPDILSMFTGGDPMAGASMTGTELYQNTIDNDFVPVLDVKPPEDYKVGG